MEIKQPKDKSHFLLPDLGEGIQEAELIKWRIKPGERVEELDVLAEMETDKALVEVPSPWAGVIETLHGGEGDIVKTGSKLVSYKIGSCSDAGADDEDELELQADAGTVVGTVDTTLAVSERFLRKGGEAPAAVATTTKALATPAVRRVARELGVDLNAIAGSGRGGRVTATDVKAAAGRVASGQVAAPSAPPRRVSAPAARHAPSTPVAVGEEGVAERIPFRGVRRKIAQALDHSVKTAVHFTVVDEADVTQLEKKRAEYAKVLGRKLSLLPFVMTAVCKALRLHPTVNANVDDEKAEILLLKEINLGCAVDTDHGLMVPVIAHADALSIVALADAVTDVAKSCRDRTIERERLVGGTFTISNVGSYGGIFSTPIINYPEVAILGVGRTQERVLTKKGMFYAGHVLPLSMSCDHRVVDGAEGARFLNTVVGLLEDEDALLRA